jgi:hypothetical protein
VAEAQATVGEEFSDFWPRRSKRTVHADLHRHDIFFFEQEGAFVVRLDAVGPAGARHELAEFTRDDIEQMIASGPLARKPDPAASAGTTPGR